MSFVSKHESVSLDLSFLDSSALSHTVSAAVVLSIFGHSVRVASILVAVMIFSTGMSFSQHVYCEKSVANDKQFLLISLILHTLVRT